MKPRIKKAPGLLPLALDSGAFSYYTKFGSAKDEHGKMIYGTGAIKHADHSYYQTPSFQKYLEDYINFLRLHKGRMKFCVSLDVIFNPEASWDIYKQMTAQGLKVLPVYHWGEDPKWLKKYLDCTDYIGVGGVGKTATMSAWLPFGERTWKLLCDNKGKPLVRVHGFAMSSFELVKRFPYHSIDSTTAFTWSRYGSLMLPNKVGSGKAGFNFSNTPIIYPVTPRRARASKHVDQLFPTGVKRAAVEEYVELLGIPFEELRTQYGARDAANLFFMNRMIKTISEQHAQKLGAKHHMLYYASGSPSSSMPEFKEGVSFLSRSGETDYLAYLGTFFQGQVRPITYLLNEPKE